MNERYFQSWSHNMAYILGFTVADGCIVCKNGAYQTILVSKDANVLEFVRSELEYEPPVKKCNDGCSRLSICRKQVVMDLMAHGILPRKSWSPLVPDIQLEYVRSFLHGLFDGDGSAYRCIRKTGSDVIGTAFYSYSKSFLEEIGNLIKEEIGAIPKVYRPSTGNAAYRLVYSVKESLGLYHMFYDRPGMDFHLERKKAVIDGWLSEVKKDMNWGVRKCGFCGRDFVAFHDKSHRCWQCKKLQKVDVSVKI